MPRSLDLSSPAATFRFKRFELGNRLAAQRIGTDGVITGAAAPLPQTDGAVIWDAGAGTGLIALMMAQRAPMARILAIELDDEAAAECRANIAASPWADRVAAVTGDFIDLSHALPRPDLIVSNPPFFTTDTHAPDSRRALARHGNGSLSPLSLIKTASEILNVGGRLCFIAPYDESDSILYAATMAGMEPVATLDISSRVGRRPIRRLWTLMRRSETPSAPPVAGTLSIHREDKPGEYTDDFISLTRDFYINL